MKKHRSVLYRGEDMLKSIPNNVEKAVATDKGLLSEATSARRRWRCVAMLIGPSEIGEDLQNFKISLVLV
jgi:hypothetical protein